MRWWRRRRQRAQDTRAVQPDVVAHLAGFAASRAGVEGWWEEPTTVQPASLLLVAADGEWTRRPVPSVRWAVEFLRTRDIPAYQAGVVGYPQRMRDYDRRRRSGPAD